MSMARRFAVGVLLAVSLVAAAQYRDRQTWEERDRWERPAEVLDKLHVQAGSTVADVGAGEGYFTVKMAERVGANGKVYAEDIDSSAVANLRKLARERGFKQVEVIEGGADDPKLPEAKLDAILVVNAYHEFRNHDAMLAAFRKALKPGGLLGIIDKAAEREASQPRESFERQHRLPESFAKEDLQRAEFTAIHDERGFDGIGSREGEHWWFVVAQRP
jgi:ubiquinone/menaquinone biosynthesis C-methylase UbiE